MSARAAALRATARARVSRPQSESTSAARTALRFDPWLLAAVLLLTTAGVVMVYSASAVFAAEKLHDPFWFFKRQSAAALAGMVALFAALKLGHKRLEKLALPLLFIAVLLLVLVQIPGLGHAAGGARRWLSIGGLTFQPSEIAKLAFVLWIARSLAKKGERVQSFAVGLAPHLLMLGLFAALLLLEPDFGTTVVLALMTFSLLIVAGAQLSWLFGIGLAALPIAGFLIWRSPYRLQRVMTFLDPWKDARGHGYQTVESLLGFGAGGAFGVGLGESHQKLFFLPAAHTDFILSIVGEEMGFCGVAFVLGLFALLVWRGLRAARAAPDAFGCYLALGLTLLISCEALVNAGMALALLPTKGMALPFFSYGMTSMVVTLFSCGVLLGISGGPGGFLKRAEGGRR